MTPQFREEEWRNKALTRGNGPCLKRHFNKLKQQTNNDRHVAKLSEQRPFWANALRQNSENSRSSSNHESSN